MKLVRYGQLGAEKPGLIDKDGTLRDLSGVIADFTADQLSDESLGKLAKIDPASLPLVPGNPEFAIANSMNSAANTGIRLATPP